MSQAAKAQEPSMEEILASIRRIIADDDGRGGKAPAAAKPAPAPAPPPPPPAPPKAVVNTQDDVDAMLADLEQPKAPPPPPAPPPVAAKPEPPPPPEPVADVLVLTEEMAAQPAPQQPAGFRTIEGSSDVVFSEPDGGRGMIDEARRQYNEDAGERLLSNATAMSVDNAFNSLAHTILGNNARTLEDLVKDMLRPMLKGWLDDNLPGLVERIVRSEIERVSRGR